MNNPRLRFTAIGGFFLDLLHVAQGKPINPHSLQKFLILNAARKATGATQFIEVGTFKGVTTHRCSKVFSTVYSIELSESLHRQASEFLATRKNVELCLGDGLHWLKVLLARPEVKNTIVFLDGHFSGGVTALGDMPEPALEELDILSRFKDKIAGVVIDDFRTFGTDEGVPPKSALLKKLESVFPESHYLINVHLDQCIVTRKPTHRTLSIAA